MLKHTEHFLGQIVLWNPVTMKESCLRSPANMQGGLDIRFSPIQDVSQLIPVINFLEWHLFDRRACDDKTIELVAADRVERDVMIEQMLGICVFGVIRCRVNERDFNLQCRIAEQAKQLGLGCDFRGHEIQNRNTQRADILMGGAFLTHNENVFIFKSCACRKCGWNFYWHSFSARARLKDELLLFSIIIHPSRSLVERLIEVPENIINVLQPNTEADKVGADARRDLIFRTELTVCCGGRMNRKTLRVADVGEMAE
jgi:hypothetical protein